MSKDYRNYIRTLPCYVTGIIGNTEPHHIIGYNWLTGKAMSRKGSDLTCIPLTSELHRQIHNIGWATFEKEHNINQLEAMIATILQAEKDGMINI